MSRFSRFFRGADARPPNQTNPSENVERLPRDPETGGHVRPIDPNHKGSKPPGRETTQVGAGHKENHITDDDPVAPEAVAKQNRDDPNSQHSREGREKDKNSFMDKVKNGAILGVAALPLALMLAATIQGGIDCDHINHTECTIRDVTSAAWPDYPDWWPEWLPAPQSDKNKVWISYTPAVHLLTTDTITIKTSNAAGDIQTSITGDHGIINNDDDSITQIQLAENFDPNTDFSNVTAKFEITTNCMDRMAYAAGQDIKAIGEAGSQFFGNIPWRSVLYIIIFIAAIWIFVKGIQIVRS